MISAKIGRFDGEINEYALDDGSSIQDLINKAGITLGEGEHITDSNGEDVGLTESMLDDEKYFIVASYKQG